MYRDIIIALRDGKTPPSDIRPYEAEVEAERASKYLVYMSILLPSFKKLSLHTR